MLRALGIRAGAATIVRVAGDSMHPTLADGDHILVDTAARTIDTGRIHVLRHDGLVLTKRLERAGRSVRIVSDNPAYPALEVAGSSVAIIGRVVALGRRL
jgi:repressor LexA